MSRPSILWCTLAWASLVVSAEAQLPLSAADAQKINPILDAPAANSLKCSIAQWRPALDFAFRFNAGYVVSCRLGIFEGRKVSVLIYSRVTPEGKPAVLFGERYPLPAVTPEMLGGMDPTKSKTNIGMSGAFGVGEGNYSVEVLVTDDRNRSCRKQWKVHVARERSQRNLPIAIQPLAVEPLIAAWDISPPPRGAGLRLTVLLDAAPISPSQSKLRAWDRAFLVESLYSLLRQAPCKSLRVVAFNLEQQRELFRSEQFDGAAFVNLDRALGDIETATVSVQALKKRNSPEFLVALAKRELAAAESSDAVIFLGPNTRMTAKTPADLLPARKAGSPPFFYFEYFPWPGGNFPDAIAQLTKALDGRTFAFHSPAELGQAIQKMLTQLKQQ